MSAPAAEALTASAMGRLEAVLADRGLGSDAGAGLASLLLTLATDPRSPTTVRDPLRAVDVHIADSLAALELPATRTASAIADLGAGAGFPGLPLAAARPDAAVRLVESNRRKCAFIATAAAAAGLTNAVPVPLRAEQWEAGLSANDLVTARALAPLAVVVEWSAPLLRRGGSLIAWKGRREAREERAGAAAAAEVGLELAEVIRSHPYAGADEHHLHVYVKVRDTPERFPRRAGIARKRPLGGSA